MKSYYIFTLFAVSIWCTSCVSEWQDPSITIDDTVSQVEKTDQGFNEINLYTIGTGLEGNFPSSLRMKSGINYNTSKDSLALLLISYDPVVHSYDVENILSYNLKENSKVESEYTAGSISLSIHEEKGKGSGFDYKIYLSDNINTDFPAQFAAIKLSDITNRPFGIQYFKSNTSENNIIRLYSCSQNNSKQTQFYSFVMVMFNSGELIEKKDLFNDPTLINNTTISYNQDYLDIPTTIEEQKYQKNRKSDFRGLPFRKYQ